MKKILSYLSLFLTHCFFINASADSRGLSNDKIYISSNDVLIGENGIFIKLDGQIIHVQGISHDSKGIYIKEINLWKCPACDRDYPGYQDECPFDGTKKPKR